jgi:hypothetical protein
MSQGSDPFTRVSLIPGAENAEMSTGSGPFTRVGLTPSAGSMLNAD